MIQMKPDSTHTPVLLSKNEIAAGNEVSDPALQRVMVWLCIAVIFLQGADAISTFIALNTGLLKEHNELLNRINHWLNWPIHWTVLMAKVAVATIFAGAMIKTKATKMNVIALILLVAFYIHVVIDNFYWISIVGFLETP